MVSRWPGTSMVPSSSPSIMRGSWVRISPVTVTSLPRTAWDVDIWVGIETVAAILLLARVCLALIFVRTQRLVHLHQRSFVHADCPGVLPNIADVVNAARQDI